MSDELSGAVRGNVTGRYLAIAVGAILLAACGSPVTGASAPTTTTTTARAAAQTVLTVNPCSVSTGIPSGGPVWVPTQLPAVIPGALKGAVEFYSTGTRTVLAPTGWVCSATEATDGTTTVIVTPPGQSPSEGANTANYENISATFDYTGHGPGMDEVCPYFPPENPSDYPGCSTTPSAGTTTSAVTPDILSITDSPVQGVRQHASQGVLLYPKVEAYASGSVDFAIETCTLSEMTLCPVVLADFEIRDFPVPSPTA